MKLSNETNDKVPMYDERDKRKETTMSSEAQAICNAISREIQRENYPQLYLEYSEDRQNILLTGDYPFHFLQRATKELENVYKGEVRFGFARTDKNIAEEGLFSVLSFMKARLEATGEKQSVRLPFPVEQALGRLDPKECPVPDGYSSIFLEYPEEESSNETDKGE